MVSTVDAELLHMGMEVVRRGGQGFEPRSDSGDKGADNCVPRFSVSGSNLEVICRLVSDSSPKAKKKAKSANKVAL